MKRGEVYLIRLDPTEGSEQAGTRPAVVITRDAINTYSPVVIVTPATNAANITRLYPSDVLVRASEGWLSILFSSPFRPVLWPRPDSHVCWVA